MRRSDYTAALGLTVLVAGTLVGSCLAAPASPSSDPWWYNPCDNHVGRLRHSRSADHYLVHVRRQFKTFLGQINANIHQLRTLYSMMPKAPPPRAGFPWLKVKNMIKKMRLLPEKKLLNLHQAIQVFAGNLDVLRHMRVKTNTTRFNEEKRKEIYNNNTQQLKLLLCEVEDAMKDNNLKVPAPMPLAKMKIKLPARIDLTGAHYTDNNFFKKMRQYFKATQRFFKDNNIKKANTNSRSSDSSAGSNVEVTKGKKSPKKRTQPKRI